MIAPEHSHLLQLDLAERMHLVEELWISIAAEQHEIPITNELLDELDRRKEKFLANPGSGMTVDETLRHIRSNLHG